MQSCFQHRKSAFSFKNVAIKKAIRNHTFSFKIILDDRSSKNIN